MNINNEHPSLGVFKLFMIAIVSVDSIRNLPITAQYGTSLLSFYLIATLGFFIPLILVTNHFTTRYPNVGGSYLWIQDAFGKQWGFVSIWLQWVYNIIWYPTIFAFISTTLATMISSSLETNKIFILLSSLGFFWILTAINCRGIRTIGRINTFYAIAGTFVPMLLIIMLAAYWLLSGHPSATPLTWHALIPKANNLMNLAFFINILFSLLGIDSIAMHAGDVRSPSRTYPKVLTLASIIIVFSLSLSSLAICIVVAPEKIGLISGLMAAYSLFFTKYNMAWAVQFIGCAIIIGGLGIASSWIISLARGLNVASMSPNSILPKNFRRLNRHRMPQVILIFQGIVFTLLTSLFLIFPDINHSYWILSSMTGQFALLYYVLLFLAAFKLLRQEKQGRGLFIWLILGLTTSIIGIFIGFIPPENVVGAKAIMHYESVIIFGAIFFMAPLYYVPLLAKRKKS